MDHWGEILSVFIVFVAYIGITVSSTYLLYLVVLSIVGIAFYVVIRRWLLIKRENKVVREQLVILEKQLSEASHRESTVFRVSRLIAESTDENEVIEQVLKLLVELVGVRGASFVPLDENARPLSVISSGDLPFPTADAWAEYIASPAIRHQCKACENHDRVTLNCPLLEEPNLDALGILCKPIGRGDQEFGVLNLYFPEDVPLNNDTRALIQSIVDETTLALDGLRLRNRELDKLHHLRTAQEKVEMSYIFSGLLEDLVACLEVDYAHIAVWRTRVNQQDQTISIGDVPSSTQLLIGELLQRIKSSNESIILSDALGEESKLNDDQSLLAVPLIDQGGTSIGAILVANMHPTRFDRIHLTMLQTMARQLALLVQFTNLMSEVEYKTMMEERTRLAREIHDGLAQTLGFLKLKAAQVKNDVETRDYVLLEERVKSIYDTLSEAYEDIRQSIDGLRISSLDEGFSAWLEPTVEVYQEESGINISICDPLVDLDLPQEIHVQLIRLVQEALSNVRKHALAQNIQISCQEVAGNMILEIIDDGIGFSPEDVPESTRYGLKGMRERAELIGADFQIIARPNEGTIVRLRLPLGILENKS